MNSFLRKRNRFLAILGFWVSIQGAFAAQEKIKIVLNGKTSAYSVSDLKRKLKVVTVSLNDPVYGQEKSFDGFRLGELLELAGLDLHATNDEIVFTAKDGYSPNTSFEQLRKHRAVLAFQEHGRKFSFEKVAQGKAMISPAPFYVVWEEGVALKDEVPWPYQLAQIEVVQFERKFPALYPASARADSDVMKGFLIFKNECIRCHSINLQGGDVGPELNAPRNVTEYWEKKTLKAFIENAYAFRYKSKMPPFPQLKGEKIDQLIEYLGFMKNSKVKL